VKLVAIVELFSISCCYEDLFWRIHAHTLNTNYLEHALSLGVDDLQVKYSIFKADIYDHTFTFNVGCMSGALSC